MTNGVNESERENKRDKWNGTQIHVQIYKYLYITISKDTHFSL